MNYEVIFGQHTFYVNAGNQYQACLKALDEQLENPLNNELGFDIEPFLVTNLSSDYQSTETIGLSEVLAIRNLSVNYEEGLVNETIQNL